MRSRLWLLVVGLVALHGPKPAGAATPSGGTLSPATPLLTYTGGPYTSVNPSPQTGAPICTPGTCDSFELVVSVPPGYDTVNPTHEVRVVVGWPDPSMDFDLYAQRPDGTIANSSASSADPEGLSLPAVSATYTIVAVAFKTVNQPISGTITLGPPAPSPYADAIYVECTDVWSDNVHLTGSTTLFNHGGDSEPGIKFDPNGTAWVGSNAGVGGGIGLWKVEDMCGRNFEFKGSPDQGIGGGDVDVEVAGLPNVNGFHNIYTTSLSLANITFSVSMDGGETFIATPVVDVTPVNDRQWNAAYGASTVWTSYRTLNTGNQLFVVRSDAGGLPGTWVGPFPVYSDVVIDATLATQLGSMACDQRPVPVGTLPLTAGPDGEANLYHGFVLQGNKVYMARSTNFGVTWQSKLVYQGAPGESFDYNFGSWAAVDAAGNVYSAFSNGRNLYYSVSTDRGNTWRTRPVRVSNGALTKTAMFPAVEAGSAGKIVFTWLASPGDGSNDATAEWHVYFARCQNALAPVPTIELREVSDHVMHHGIVCLNGIGCTSGRELLEDWEVAINPVDGSSMITYTDNGEAGGTYITRQLSGKSSLDGHVVNDVVDVCSNGPPPPDPCGTPGVAILAVPDPNGDQLVPNDPQADIEQIYFAEPFLGIGQNRLVITMKVDQLTPGNLPPNRFWRTFWTNPGDGIRYTVRMLSDVNGNATFDYGHITTGQVVDGPASGTYDADGFITITIDKALVGNPMPGQTLTAITMDTRLNGVAVFAPNDDTAAGSYDVHGNDFCAGSFTVTCPGDFSGVAGDYPLSFQVTNRSAVVASYNFSLSDANGWIVNGPFNGVLSTVNPGATASFAAIVRIPNGCLENTTDNLQWNVALAGSSPAEEQGCETIVTCAPPAPPESPCELPGITIVTDPAGDMNLGGGDPQDIRQIWIAEPFFGTGVNRIVTTMKVPALDPDPANLPPNAFWKVLWTGPDGVVYFVEMNTTTPTLPAFNYGHVDENDIETTDGAADAGHYTADGFIEITVSSSLVGGTVAGQTLGNVRGVTSTLVGAVGFGVLLTIDDSGSRSYLRVGNDSCEPCTGCFTTACPAPIEVMPGAPYALDFCVTNCGPVEATFGYALDDSLNWCPDEAGNLTIPAGQTACVTLNCTSPGSLADGAVNRYRFTVTDVTANSCQDPEVCTTDVTYRSPVYVALARFEATAAAGSVEIVWESSAETDHAFFDVLRSREAGGEFVRLNAAPIRREDGYRFTDSGLETGTYFYRLEAVDRSGRRQVFGPLEVRVEATPALFALKQNYPNPFSSSTQFRVDLPREAEVRVRLYDSAGRLIRTFVENSMPAGSHVFEWDGRDDAGRESAAGFYFLRAEASGSRQTVRIMRIR